VSFKEAYDLVERRIEDRYGIGVAISDVQHPNTGDFDGSRILVDFDQELETAFFVLVHLFGHTVQWNISAHYRELGADLRLQQSEERLKELYHYERDATRYSVKLMHDAKVTGLDQWVSDYWAADWKYLEHFYRTGGERLPFAPLLKFGEAELLTPLEIPEFTPQKWMSRWSF
jgi:hypothetical protein